MQSHPASLSFPSDSATDFQQKITAQRSDNVIKLPIERSNFDAGLPVHYESTNKEHLNVDGSFEFTPGQNKHELEIPLDTIPKHLKTAETEIEFTTDKNSVPTKIPLSIVNDDEIVPVVVEFAQITDKVTVNQSDKNVRLPLTFVDFGFLERIEKISVFFTSNDPEYSQKLKKKCITVEDWDNGYLEIELAQYEDKKQLERVFWVTLRENENDRAVRIGENSKIGVRVVNDVRLSTVGFEEKDATVHLKDIDDALVLHAKRKNNTDQECDIELSKLYILKRLLYFLFVHMSLFSYCLVLSLSHVRACRWRMCVHRF